MVWDGVGLLVQTEKILGFFVIVFCIKLESESRRVLEFNNVFINISRCRKWYRALENQTGR